MTPPPTAPRRSDCHRTFPLPASRAKALPLKSPAKTMPPFVGVMPETTGASDLYRHFTWPESASVATTHPPHLGSRTPNRLAGSAPVHDCPRGTFAAF